MSSRKPFVFSLTQNFAPQLAAGKLLYDKKPIGLVDRLTPIFFIGTGRLKWITGPYELLSEIKYEPIEDIKNMSRMDEVDSAYGVWNEIRIGCPYFVEFRPLYPINKGFVWNDKFCRKYGFKKSAFSNLVTVSMTLGKIDKLADELKRINGV
ncbi:MAG: hypothetical protein U9M89_01075 [Patescibacteria group bacterium]|nr:hypothetical protein [Patescibacteria group bacterium]